MSALVFCRECYSWGVPRGEECAHCRGPLDLNRPDPPESELAAAIGTVLDCLGEVRTPRRLLPPDGLLYATTGGLFFLPNETQPDDSATGANDETSLAGVLIGLLFPLIGIIGALAYLARSRKRPVRLPRLESDAAVLAGWLMADPGAFFIPRRSIQVIRRGWRGWTVECTDRPNVRLRPTDRAGFAAHLADTAAREPWRGTFIV